jgi:hypothetical protein
MTNIRSIIGTLLVVVMVALGGWVTWQSVAEAEAATVIPLAPLNITADQLSTSDGLAILSDVYDDPTAQFELPVARPDQASVGKQNLFQ